VSIQVRVCPICSYRQHRQDPTGHVCASVLRETLRLTHAELDNARASIASLERDLAASERYGRAAHARGFSAALRVALVLLGRVPGAGLLLGRELQQLAEHEHQTSSLANR
jgi:hypothetical protein